ncbi:MAG: sigma-70 family RNA polymerase sigma factor [Alphaproteobacteria bacterium]|nr:sigma-70 family RNA polymerase sigma factor [Alphaproteobacteria bacterium]MBU1515348.1 sigma-70 family RNA polymerase sigma factor [Alphaproteobacteria bacterium]MBU2095398.1 sigma-70 family RNA polymerase sigma factor [Alphaproteobacteria bacterium]MBU2152582.1 sigma-70 family RNA polymerase sigma factor [Alphaproteobacteria bacterium]MBU2309978.1 sigma-70 family RNA polymerase sigma factor [Alphaproteobacteria bacterium]
MAPSGPSETPGEDGPLIRAFFEKRESLLLFLAARTRCMATAEDLIQDLYLKIAALDGGTDVRAPSALLYRMAANILVDHVRSSQRSSRRNSDWRQETRTVMGGEDVVDEPAADEVLAAKQRVRLLADAVAELPLQMRRAFRLHKLEGLSQAQTAQAMGVSVKMIEQHIQAAIRNLSQRLRS